MKQRVFCYGTLTLPRVMAAVIGRHVCGSPATLEGFRCARLRGRPYPGVWPHPGAVTGGVLYRLQHRRELGRLDRYEGPEYRRRRLTVMGQEGAQTAWVYLPRAGRRRAGPAWSADAFARRAQRRYLRQIPLWRRNEIAAPDADPA